jgi:hypothetical protein|tara:strand:+ start:540 stop:713 length:174 start_codon:yes stop_codon:yes gene_type:complete
MMNYKKGGKEIKIEPSKVIVDPRSEVNVQKKPMISAGNKEAVKGFGAARKQKDVTWY